jgi:hypothetical protein
MDLELNNVGQSYYVYDEQFYFGRIYEKLVDNFLHTNIIITSISSHIILLYHRKILCLGLCKVGCLCGYFWELYQLLNLHSFDRTK